MQLGHCLWYRQTFLCSKSSCVCATYIVLACSLITIQSVSVVQTQIIRLLDNERKLDFQCISVSVTHTAFETQLDFLSDSMYVATYIELSFLGRQLQA